MIWLCLYRCLAPKPPLQELTDFVPPSLTEWGEPYWNWVAMTLKYAYPRWSSCCHSSSAYLRAFGGSLSASATTGNKLSHSFNLANCTTNYRGKQIFAGIWSWQEAWRHNSFPDGRVYLQDWVICSLQRSSSSPTTIRGLYENWNTGCNSIIYRVT